MRFDDIDFNYFSESIISVFTYEPNLDFSFDFWHNFGLDFRWWSAILATAIIRLVKLTL